MTENVDTDTTKANLANLTKIPVTEFEKHFHEWMERDDVARGLQAKLRCDLIKNFNKTNLGKQLMSATGGSTYRLTLTPLVLALNTLVAEFLYAQNSHFTLSVFCTEVPFRNTLPDFECMRNFRFNEREIREIWDAVTNAASSRLRLDPAVIEDYESSPNNSLLLLFLKSLVNQKPPEMLRKSIEIQTEHNEIFLPKHQRSASVQVSQLSPVKTQSKGQDNLKHLNKYLLILTQKVDEMTKEFELLIRERNVPKLQRSARKSARSREFHSLNRSLERINENVKQLAKSKRKSKRLTNVVESIDGLTKQFAKCAENFGQVTQELSKKEEKILSSRETHINKSVKEVAEKSYVDWVNEMRTTNNGKKFLERVEKSLQKANNKYREQLEAETEVKVKHIKSLLRMHFKQKMILRLARQDGGEHPTESRKLNDEIEMRLKQCEMKQTELVKQLQESSFEHQEAQSRLAKENEQKEESLQKENSGNIEKVKAPNVIHMQPKKCKKTVRILNDVPQNYVTPRDLDVEKIINETKIRLQQLETESSCLEQNFLSCLERRKQQHLTQQESSLKLITESQTKTAEIFEKLGITSRVTEAIPPKPYSIHNELDTDDEFVKLKEKLQDSQDPVNTATNGGSGSPLEMRNPIEDAKNTFFEYEDLLRKSKAKELLEYSATVEDKMSGCCEAQQFSYQSQTEYRDQEEMNQISCELSTYSWNFVVPGDKKNLDGVFDAKNCKTESFIAKKTETRQNTIDSPRVSQDLSKGTVRKELFPKEIPLDVENEAASKQDLQQSLKELKSYTDNLQRKDKITTETTNELLKQSMAKMKQLFEENENHTKPKVINFKYSQDKTPLQQHPDKREHLDLSHTTTASTTSSCNTTTTATSTSLLPSAEVKLLSRSDTFKTFHSPDTTGNDRNIFTKNQLPSHTPLSNLATSASTLGPKDNNTQEKLSSIFPINRASHSSIPTALLNVTTSESDEGSLKSRAQDDHSSESNDDDEDDDDEEDDDEDDDDDVDEGEDNDENAHSDEEEEENYKSESEEKMEIAADVPELVFTPKDNSIEVGEVLSEPKSQFAAVPVSSTSESSAQSDSEMHTTTGKVEKGALGKTSDDSESDFWA